MPVLVCECIVFPSRFIAMCYNIIIKFCILISNDVEKVQFHFPCLQPESSTEPFQKREIYLWQSSLSVNVQAEIQNIAERCITVFCSVSVFVCKTPLCYETPTNSSFYFLNSTSCWYYELPTHAAHKIKKRKLSWFP